MTADEPLLKNRRPGPRGGRLVELVLDIRLGALAELGLKATVAARTGQPSAPEPGTTNQLPATLPSAVSVP
jgi:hypothetical protein